MKITIQNFLIIIISLYYLPTCAQINPLWVAVYKGVNPNIDLNNDCYAIAIDNFGNAYVTGMTDPYQELCVDTYITTIKYFSSNGGQAWLNRYSGCAPTQMDADAGKSIAIYISNEHNYIYVTGRTYKNGYGKDIATIQYDDENDGNILWIRTYHGSGNGDDEANHIEVDSEGNSYVTGFCYNFNDSVYNYDFTTIKYDFYGNLRWVQTYNGTANGNDFAKSLKLIGGTVYITGTSAGYGTGEDIVTIAYDKNQGNEIWLSRYNNGLSDRANDIAVGRNILDDIPRDIYVTGSSGDNIFTIRYDYSNGTIVWAKNNITGVGNSIGVYIGEDYTTNIFVTGFTKISDIHYGITVKYDKEGNEQWDPNPIYSDERSDFVSLGIDGSENVYVFGSVYIDNPGLYLTAKYNSNGVLQWSDVYQYPNSFFGSSRNMKVDINGYSYIAGSFYLTNSPTPAYYVTLKYAP